ncbi:hypothetical protein JZ751_021639, partial [Albula glossodonta]
VLHLFDYGERERDSEERIGEEVQEKEEELHQFSFIPVPGVDTPPSRDRTDLQAVLRQLPRCQPATHPPTPPPVNVSPLAESGVHVRVAHTLDDCSTSGEMGDRPESGSATIHPQPPANKSKLGASLVTLCRRAWVLLKAGGRKGFERSPSAARLVASE